MNQRKKVPWRVLGFGCSVLLGGGTSDSQGSSNSNNGNGENQNAIVNGQLTSSNGSALVGYSLIFQPTGTMTTTGTGGFFTVSLKSGNYSVSVYDENGSSVGTYSAIVNSDGSVVISNASPNYNVNMITVNGTLNVLSPYFNPTPGSFSSDFSLTLGTPTQGAIIYYIFLVICIQLLP
ncbi:MAG: hypothetical protein IPL26_23790 [Leptospiraceae bacterium]|nr:hypothetical protein [Leptospiraceae bacterium]